MSKFLLARGPRVLGADCFPWMDSAIRSIETIRSQYSYLETEGQPDPDTQVLNREFHFQPVVSIIGPRGSGKTSALLTLISRLRMEHPTDLILDPLDPHRFLDHDKLLYWFLAALSPHVTRIAEQERIRGMSAAGGPSGVGRDVAGAPWHGDTLSGLFHELSEQARWMFQSSGAGAVDDRLEQRFRQHFLAKSLDFARQTDRLVRRLTSEIARHRAARSGARDSHGLRELPLLILPVDDADLVPEYLDDLITLLRILTPWVSRLVVLVTMDEQLATMTLRARYLQMMFPEAGTGPVTARQSADNEGARKVIGQLASQSLTKLIPQAQRFLLEPLSLAQRADFRPVLEDGAPTLLELMQQNNLQRFFNLTWAIRPQRHEVSGQREGRVWSEYLSFISSNPRVLEQAYDVLLTSGSDQDERRRMFSSLYRLFVASRYPDELRMLTSLLHMEAVGERRLLLLAPGVDLRLSFHPATPFTLRVPGGDATDSVRVSAHGFFEIHLTVTGGQHQLADESSASFHIPTPLTLAYLSLQESRRPDLTYFTIAGDIPGYSLATLAPVQPSPILPTKHQGADASTVDRQVQARLAFPYPISVQKGAGGYHSSLYCLPMPAWRFPIQWWVFFAYWGRVLTGIRTWNDSRTASTLVFHLIQAAIAIGSMDPISERAESLAKLDCSAGIPDNMDDIIAPLGAAYQKDVVSGDGILAAWVERGLYRFLSLLEENGDSPFATIGLTSALIMKRVMERAIAGLEQDPTVGPRLQKMRDQLQSQLQQPGEGSLLFERFAHLGRFSGARNQDVGVIGIEGQGLTEYGTATVDGVSNPEVGAPAKRSRP